jgi:hypothetical protein
MALENLVIPGASVIRHFDRSGNVLGGFVPQSTILNPMSLSSPSSSLRASSDRTAWYSADGRYVEISAQGTVLTDINVPVPGSPSHDTITGFAITDSAQVFLSASFALPQNVAPPGYQRSIYVLDRASRVWNPVLTRTGVIGAPAAPTDVSASNFGRLCGVAGQVLVVLGGQFLKFYAIGN